MPKISSLPADQNVAPTDNVLISDNGGTKLATIEQLAEGLDSTDYALRYAKVPWFCAIKFAGCPFIDSNTSTNNSSYSSIHGAGKYIIFSNRLDLMNAALTAQGVIWTKYGTNASNGYLASTVSTTGGMAFVPCNVRGNVELGLFTNDISQSSTPLAYSNYDQSKLPYGTLVIEGDLDGHIIEFKNLKVPNDLQNSALKTEFGLKASPEYQQYLDSDKLTSIDYMLDSITVDRYGSYNALTSFIGTHNWNNIISANYAFHRYTVQKSDTVSVNQTPLDNLLKDVEFKNLLYASNMFEGTGIIAAYNRNESFTLSMPKATFESLVNASRMFSGCYASKLDIPNANFSNVVDASYMFYSARGSGSVNTGNYYNMTLSENILDSMTSIEDASGMFQVSYVHPDCLAHLHVSNIKNATYMFGNYYGRAGGSESNDTTSGLYTVIPEERFDNLENATGMFNTAHLSQETFSKLNINWSNVKNASQMFYNTKTVNSTSNTSYRYYNVITDLTPLADIDLSSLERSQNMFACDPNFGAVTLPFTQLDAWADKPWFRTVVERGGLYNAIPSNASSKPSWYDEAQSYQPPPAN